MADEEYKKLQQRVSEVEQQNEQLRQQLARYLPDGETRRGFIKGTSAAVAAGGLGFATGAASADASTSDSDPDVGEPNDRVDVFGDGGDFNQTDSKRFSDTIYNIAEYSGYTLNARWDTIRSNLTAGEPYVLLIPPGTGAETATDSDGRWQVNSPLEFTNTENRGDVYAYGTYIEAAANITNLVELSGTNKPESIKFYGGQWCAGDESLTSIFYSDGLSDCLWKDLSVNLFGTGSVSYAFDFESSNAALSDSVIQNVECNSISDTACRLRNTGNGVTRFEVQFIVNSGGLANYVVDIEGDVSDVDLRGVYSNSGATSAVVLGCSGTGYPVELDIENVHSDGGSALQTEDRSGGSAPRMRNIRAKALHGQVSGPNVDINYAQQMDIEIAQFSPGIEIGSNVRDVSIDTIEGVSFSTTIAAGADRIVINGVGENAGDPNSTGQWNGNGYEGAVVVDTTNSVTYHYRGGGWV